MGAQKTIIIVGGSQGGPSAAARARQVNECARIILIEESRYIAWIEDNACHYLGPNHAKFELAMSKKESYFSERYNIEIMTNTRALVLDIDAQVLFVQTKEGQNRIAYDSLVYACGAGSKKLDLPELTGARVTHFRTFDDVKQIREAYEKGARRAVIVGCGFYGTQAALALNSFGFSVAVVEKKWRIMPKFSATFAHHIQQELVKQGVKFYLNNIITQVSQSEDDYFSLFLDSGCQLEADVVVVCTGIEAKTLLLANAGAALDSEGRVRVDDTMATTLPNVFACGNDVSVPHALTSERTWVPQPAVVLRTAQVAGANAACSDSKITQVMGSICGTLLTKLGEIFFARTGLLECEAKYICGEENVLVTTVFGPAQEPWVSAQETCVRIIIDKRTQKLIGGEVFGPCGVDRRIDLLAAGIAKEWTLLDLINLDMSYFADLGPVFDPLKDAAYRAQMALGEGIEALSAEKLALWLKNETNFCLVDVGHTPLLSGRENLRVRHIPLEEMRERFHELQEESSPIVLFSQAGFRSYLAERALRQRGVAHVYHLDGGAATWKLLSDSYTKKEDKADDQ